MLLTKKSSGSNTPDIIVTILLPPSRYKPSKTRKLCTDHLHTASWYSSAVIPLKASVHPEYILAIGSMAIGSVAK
ncbi:hypothetical protein DPMN_017650 [Dreissena polymorpha]|uniref:Uncharacterized protein n=1 Tax=Dreissena polymorpha TaxID=45954 RepID=A0A9D4S7N2_DREPO|nr:hypothetical protein DPMN_017650 [Dreissena polymorpha]